MSSSGLQPDDDNEDNRNPYVQSTRRDMDNGQNRNGWKGLARDKCSFRVIARCLCLGSILSFGQNENVVTSIF